MPVSCANSHTLTVKAAIVMLLTASLGLISANKAYAQFADSTIAATYHVEYNGLHMGKVHFNSTVKGRSYKMATSSKFQIPLLGSIFESLTWSGVTRTSGTFIGNKPRPQKYYFSFRNNKKQGQIDMAFSGNRVSRVARIPNKKLSIKNVPVTRAHLSKVMDPMSAIMLIRRTGKSHRTACNNTIPIYDGKQRFNLKLSYKRAIRVNRSQSGGYRGPVIICRVHYRPIAGYKPHKKDVKFMVNNRGIELWLMPLPKSRNYAPYRFKLPLPVGSAEAYLSNFNIRNANGRKVALVRQ